MKRRAFFQRLLGAAPAPLLAGIAVTSDPHPVTTVNPHCSRCGNALMFIAPLRDERRYDPNEKWTLTSCACGTQHPPIARFAELPK